MFPWYWHGPLAFLCLLVGVQWNVSILKKVDIDMYTVLNWKTKSTPTSYYVYFMCFIGLQLFWYSTWVLSNIELYWIWAFYVCVWFSLWTTSIGDEMRILVLPSFSQRPSFMKVWLADLCTSCSKMIQDFSIVLVWTWYLVIGGQNDDIAVREAFKHYLFPYVMAASPYALRALQCYTSRRHCTDPQKRFQHACNFFKYVSGMLVIGVGACPKIGITSRYNAEGIVFVIVATFHSLYSYIWDITMDWGLATPQVHRRVKYLRPHIHFHRLWYYMAMVLDFILRIVWVTRWFDRWHGNRTEWHLALELVEVARRIGWNVFRIEWEYIQRQIVPTYTSTRRRGHSFKNNRRSKPIEAKVV